MELRRSGLIPLNPAGEPIIVADHPDQRHAARTKRLLSVHDRACWMAVGQSGRRGIWAHSCARLALPLALMPRAAELYREQIDLGFFDQEFGRVECAENPFGAKVSPMSPERTLWVREDYILRPRRRVIRPCSSWRNL